jgi:phosphoribosylglycinamide formyltransferase-1
MKNVAIFASGSGSNAQAIIEYLHQGTIARVSCILSNNRAAYVLERAKARQIPVIVFTRDDFYKSDRILVNLEKYSVDFIVLAGFLWLVPENLITRYPNRIINIHPALLPKYGGKGMYGMKVHKTVIEKGEPVSGISIHYVNEKYDDGSIIFQASCKVNANDTPETLAEKIHRLEHEHFPRVVEKLVKGLSKTE